MTDAELADYLGISNSRRRDDIIRRLTPVERAAYNDMRDLEDQLRLFEQGKGPMPKGVIVCRRGKK